MVLIVCPKTDRRLQTWSGTGFFCLCFFGFSAEWYGKNTETRPISKIVSRVLRVCIYIHIYMCVRIFYARDSWPTTAQTWGSCSPDPSLGKRRRTRWRDNRMNWRSQFWKLVLQRQVPVSSCPRLVTQPHSLGRGAWQMVAVVLQLPILIHHSFNHTSMWDVFVYIIQWRSLKCDEKVTWSHSSSQGASVRRMGGYAQREREMIYIYI